MQTKLTPGWKHLGMSVGLIPADVYSLGLSVPLKWMRYITSARVKRNSVGSSQWIHYRVNTFDFLTFTLNLLEWMQTNSAQTFDTGLLN